MSQQKTKIEKIEFMRGEPVEYFDGERCTFIRNTIKGMCIISTSKNAIRHGPLGNIKKINEKL